MTIEAIMFDDLKGRQLLNLNLHDFIVKHGLYCTIEQTMTLAEFYLFKKYDNLHFT